MLTVVTPATSRRLATVANVRADLSIGVEAMSDTQVGRMIDQATSAIESYCDRVFAQQVYRETYPQFRGADAIAYQRWPVTEIVTVTQGGSVLATDGYESDGRRLYRLGSGGRVCWPQSSLVMEYKAGWIMPGVPVTGLSVALPPAVELACIGEVSAIMSRRSRDPLVRSETEEGVGSTSWQIQSGMGPLTHPDSAGLLSEYRVMCV
jgi:hypothetical protein